MSPTSHELDLDYYSSETSAGEEDTTWSESERGRRRREKAAEPTSVPPASASPAPRIAPQSFQATFTSPRRATVNNNHPPERYNTRSYGEGQSVNLPVCRHQYPSLPLSPHRRVLSLSVAFRSRVQVICTTSTWTRSQSGENTLT